MKLFRLVTSFALLAALVHAQAPAPNIPDCALTCLYETIPGSACALSDIPCQCTNTKLATAVTACMLKQCSLADTLQLGRAQAVLCNRPNTSRRHTIFSTIIASTVFIVIAVALRLLSRGLVTRRLFLEDGLIIVALLAALAASAMSILMSIYGFGRNIYDLSASDVRNVLFYFWIGEFLYNTLINFTKFSLLASYWRVFKDTRFRLYVKLVTIYVAMTFLANILATLFQCQPIKAAWDKDIKNAKCVNYTTFLYVAAAISASHDLIILALPIPQLASLHMSRKRKFGMFSMFSIGGLVCIMAIVRLGFLIDFAHSRNPTWDNVPGVIWSVLEGCTAIICTCMPAIRALCVDLYRRHFKRPGASSAGCQSIFWSRFRSATSRRPGDSNRTKASKSSYGTDSAGWTTLGYQGAADLFTVRTAREHSPSHENTMQAKPSKMQASQSGCDDIPLESIQHDTSQRS